MFAERDYARQLKAQEIRNEAAEIAFERPHPQRKGNGEEEAYGYLANFHKGLPHNQFGEVQHSAYRALLDALATGDANDFENIPLSAQAERKLVNPQSGIAFDLEGPDAQSLRIAPAPRIDGPENSAEMGELYWIALLRDTPFKDYKAGGGLVGEAVASLNKDFSDFRGPKDETSGKVTSQTLFRGITDGDVIGPYVSQFLLKGNADDDFGAGFKLTEKDGYIRFGTLRIDQRNKVAVPKKNYLTDFSKWLAIQNGAKAAEKDEFQDKPRFLSNLRDLATYVHFDQLYEAYFNACIYLLASGAPFGEGNPYQGSRTQDGFGTFGGPHILSLLTEVSTRALKAVWNQKWYVHRRLRPEAFAGLIHVHLSNDFPGKRYDMIDPEIIQSLATGGLDARFEQSNGYLLPMAFPEGSPMHPAYGAGHATVAGACVTILKAWFEENKEMSNPVEASADGMLLENYNGIVKLTVGGELDKLAANIAIARNAAGVHWRSDYTESIKLGEAVAIGILQEQSLTYNERRVDGTAPFFTFTRFDKRICRIEDGQVFITPAPAVMADVARQLDEAAAAAAPTLEPVANAIPNLG